MAAKIKRHAMPSVCALQNLLNKTKVTSTMWLWGNVPSNGLYFLSYEAIQNSIKERTHSENLGLLSAIFAGGMAGIFYWVVGMPPDVLKSRLQTAPEGTYPHGVRSVFKELMHTDGPLALYRGVAPVMLRAFPANAACFFGIELANTFFRIVAPDF